MQRFFQTIDLHLLLASQAYSEDFEKYLHTLSLSDGGFDRVAEAVEINFQQIKRLTEDVADMRDKLATSFAVIKSAKSSKVQHISACLSYAYSNPACILATFS